MLNADGIRKAQLDIIKPCSELVDIIMQGDNTNLDTFDYVALRNYAITVITQELHRQFTHRSLDIDFVDSE